MTRKEAIEVYHGLINEKIKEAFEFFAPELRESKDERVRKAILGLTYLDGIEPILTKCSITAGDIRAYLEKQKEEEGYEAIPVESTLEYKLGFKAGKESEKQKEQKPWKVGANAYFTPEQKPAEWSEEDERMRDRLITRLNWITYNTRTDGTSPNITFFDEIAWLKSLPLQLKEAYKDGF